MSAQLAPEVRAEWRAVHTNHVHLLDGQSFPERCDICFGLALLEDLAATEQRVANTATVLAATKKCNSCRRNDTVSGTCSACGSDQLGIADARAENAEATVEEARRLLGAGTPASAIHAMLTGADE